MPFLSFQQGSLFKPPQRSLFVLPEAPWDTGKAPLTGAVRAYQRTGNQWVEISKLMASDGTNSDGFGQAVDIDGNVAVIGSPDDDDVGQDYGAVYVFERFGSLWLQTSKIVPVSSAVNDHFGRSVALEGNRLVVGATPNNNSNVGHIYVFQKFGAIWGQTAKLTSTFDSLGAEVALSGDRIIGTAQFGHSPSAGNSRAAIYELVGGNWTLVLSANSPFNSYSADVAIIGDDAFISSYPATVRRFARIAGVWTFAENLPTAGLGVSSFFGDSLSAVIGSLAVGAPTESPGGFGRAIIFKPSPFGWKPAIDLVPQTASASIATFGTSIALDGGLAVVGIPHSDGSATSSGMAAVFPASADFAFQPHGLSCPGSAGFSPSLVMSGCAVPGGGVTLEVSGGVGGSTVILGLGLNPTSQLMEGGCFVWISPISPNVLVLPLFGSGAGSGAISITAPLPIMIGVPASIELQGFLIDPGVPHGYTTTNAVRMTIYPG
jgi:hypothetical protein